MSEKEYEIKFNDDDTATIREKKQYSSSNERKKTNPEPTKRELVGYSVRGMNRTTKVVLTLLFDIYGIIHRWSCNKGWVCYLSVFFLGWQIFSLISFANAIETGIDIENILCFLPWSIDIICVALFGEVKLFAHKKYKDFKG